MSQAFRLLCSVRSLSGSLCAWQCWTAFLANPYNSFLKSRKLSPIFLKGNLYPKVRQGTSKFSSLSRFNDLPNARAVVSDLLRITCLSWSLVTLSPVVKRRRNLELSSMLLRSCSWICWLWLLTLYQVSGCVAVGRNGWRWVSSRFQGYLSECTECGIYANSRYLAASFCSMLVICFPLFWVHSDRMNISSKEEA